jgi:hypothetical protein
MAASKASASASVSTRQIVVFDGGPAGTPPARIYRSAKTAAGTSLTHPGNGGVAPHPGDHRRGGQRQHHRDRMITTLT